MGSKVIVASAVSLLLVVGIVIGTVVLVKNNGNDEEKNNYNNSANKAVTSFCAPTPYKEACERSIENVAKNSTATPKDYIKAAIQATVEDVKKAIEVTNGVRIDEKADLYHYLAVEDCKRLLQDAVDELQLTFSIVDNSELHTLSDQVHDLLNWLGGANAYQAICVDQLRKPEYKSVVENGTMNASQLTHNVIAVVAKITEVLNAFNIDTNNVNHKSRRLLDVNEIGHDGYPTWFTGSDRRLLAASAAGQLKPHAVVAKDGSGQYKTISSAIAAYPPHFKGRYTIYVKAGIYNEYVTVDKQKIKVAIIGDGIGKTIVTGKKSDSMNIPVEDNGTFQAIGHRFIAKGITFRNEAGPNGNQAVALKVQSDRSAFFECSMEGHQDTLYYKSHLQFYRDCEIYGTIDFIFGMGTAVIQNSKIFVRMGNHGQYYPITADGRDDPQLIHAGLVLQNCVILADKSLEPEKHQWRTYLGRPWKQYAKTVIMGTEIPDFIQPKGYIIFETNTKPNYNEKTCEYLEYANRGLGANVGQRDYNTFKKSRAIGAKEATQYTPNEFLKGGQWLRGTGVPHMLGLTS